MPTLYQITEWQQHFETNETRKLAVLRWLPKPNKHDGLGFGRMRAERDKVQLFCAWCLLLDVASKTTPRERRGFLERSGKPLDADDIAYLTGYPAEIFTRALEFFSSSSVGWLTTDKTLTGDTSADSLGRPPRPLGDSPAVLKGREGIEGKEGKVIVAPLQKKSFVKPTIEEVRLNCAKIGLPESEAEKFIAFYDSNGWRVGSNPMKSWQGAMINWRTNFQGRAQANEKSTGGTPTTSTTDKILMGKEYERIIERMRQIKGQYGEMQSWTLPDIDEFNRLKFRKNNLKKILGITI